MSGAVYGAAARIELADRGIVFEREASLCVTRTDC
jgi:hypothetical protein